MNKYVGITLAVGALAIVGYFLYSSTQQKASACAGDWTDAVNPACWIQGATTTVTNEANTILLIVAAVIIVVVALLAFGPQTAHIARVGTALAVV